MEEVFLLVSWGEDTTGEGFGLGSVKMSSTERKLKSKCRLTSRKKEVQEKEARLKTGEEGFP